LLHSHIFPRFLDSISVFFATYSLRHAGVIIQGDHKVSVYLTIIVQLSGPQRLFDHPVPALTLAATISDTLHLTLTSTTMTNGE